MWRSSINPMHFFLQMGKLRPKEATCDLCNIRHPVSEWSGARSRHPIPSPRPYLAIQCCLSAMGTEDWYSIKSVTHECDLYNLRVKWHFRSQQCPPLPKKQIPSLRSHQECLQTIVPGFSTLTQLWILEVFPSFRQKSFSLELLPINYTLISPLKLACDLG